MSAPRFRRGIRTMADAMATDGVPFQAHLLSDDDKEHLCRSLLAEFGVGQVKRTPRGELVHSCVLPLGGHPRGDRKPSAQLNYKSLTFTCWSCGHRGGLVWFISTCRDCTETQAKKWLRTEFAYEGENTEGFLAYLDALEAGSDDHEVPIPTYHPRVLEPWEKIHPYLTDIRGLPADNIVRHRVGWDAETNRIVVPHFWRGDLVGWQTRRLTKDGTPKWKSTPEFPRDRTLYYADGWESPVVVEAPLSVVAKSHLLEMCATFGSAVSERQQRILRRYESVTLWFDHDPAGWEATHVLGESLMSYMPVWVVVPPSHSPKGTDPADFSDDKAQELVADAIPYALWTAPTIEEVAHA